MFFTTVNNMNNLKISQNLNNRHCSFKARKVAVARPIVDGIKKEIEIYRLGNRDKDCFGKIVETINLAQLLPSKINAPNFNVWQNLIEAAYDCIGHVKHQRIFLAVQDNKPCGVLLASCNNKQGEVVTFATWPVGLEQKVKKAGSSLFTAFLKLVEQKKLKRVKLEPLINGPTDSVGFYLSHGMEFADKCSSLMVAGQKNIKSTLTTKIDELDYEVIKHPRNVRLATRVNLETV